MCMHSGAWSIPIPIPICKWKKELTALKFTSPTQRKDLSTWVWISKEQDRRHPDSSLICSMRHERVPPLLCIDSSCWSNPKLRIGKKQGQRDNPRFLGDYHPNSLSNRPQLASSKPLLLRNPFVLASHLPSPSCIAGCGGVSFPANPCNAAGSLYEEFPLDQGQRQCPFGSANLQEYGCIPRCPGVFLPNPFYIFLWQRSPSALLARICFASLTSLPKLPGLPTTEQNSPVGHLWGAKNEGPALALAGITLLCTQTSKKWYRIDGIGINLFSTVSQS